jgi:hypothetical protein
LVAAAGGEGEENRSPVAREKEDDDMSLLINSFMSQPGSAKEYK